MVQIRVDHDRFQRLLVGTAGPASRLLERRVVGCTHHEGLNVERHFILRSERDPFRVCEEVGKDLIPVSAVAIRQHPHQRVRIVELLPGSDDLGTVFFKERDLALTESLVRLSIPPLPSRAGSAV